MDDVERRELQDLAHEDLVRYRDMQREIDQYGDRIKQLEAQSESATQVLNPNKVKVNSDEYRLENIMVELIDKRRDYGDMIIAAERVAMEIEVKLDMWLDGIERRVIRGHYLLRQRLEEIAVKENYSHRQIKRFKWNALLNYGKKLKEYNKKS